MSYNNMRVNSGIHPDANFSGFSGGEQEIIHKCFASEFYVTNSGGIIKLGKTSQYRYFLIKFTDIYKEQFNLEREIIVLFSDYDNFEPRTLDAYDAIYKEYQDLRIEKICSFLISKDYDIEQKISQLLKSSSESQVIVPFIYKEFNEIADFYFFRNRISKHFYSRDLFSFESALKKDIYFFGRTDIVHNIANRHRNSENSGLFGLRKIGKTSIIFAIRRLLKANDEYSVYIDCQNPSVYLKRWNHLLKHVIDEIVIQNNFGTLKLSDDIEYSELNCSQAFENDMKKIKKKAKLPILMIFDEVERITFDLSSNENWKSGDDFIHFWRAMRSVFQKNEKFYTYLIVSTNPKSVETVKVKEQDNPLFSQIPIEYIKPFTVKQTEEMVGKLANIMGLEFDEIIYSKLTEDFGGHPFLIRMVCSVINSLVKEIRPVKIDKINYQSGKEVFNKKYHNYIEMVIFVLNEYYNEEYEMMKYLALGDIGVFNELAELSNDLTNHLLGYNIIEHNNGNYYFKIESIKNYLLEKNKYKKTILSDEEKIAEISERRNNIEPKIRQIIRSILQANMDINDAKKAVLSIMGEPRQSKYYNNTFRELFEPNIVEVYFNDLRKIINKQWELFKNIFNKDQISFDKYMNDINIYRIDAHSKSISDEDMNNFRISITKIENMIKDYL